MLNVECPSCKKGIKVNNPKQGKFAPNCQHCKVKFQLLIKQMPDKSFRYKASLIPAKKSHEKSTEAVARPKERPSQSDQATIVAGKTEAPIHEDTATADDQASNRQQPQASKKNPIGNDATRNSKGGTVGVGSPKANTAVSGRPQGVRNAGPMPNGGRLGPYQLIRLLGQGGMGAVYLANQTTLDRNVALKVVRANLTKHASMLARFTREAYAAAQLIHPNVVQIYDMGDDRGNCYFSMELVNGKSLLDYVNEKKKVDPEQATIFILHAARGLRCAHNAGMVHRDIKPANLLVNEDGVVKVADLGLVKVPDHEEIEHEVRDGAALSASQDLTQVGTAIGTPYYMAPEQAKSAIDCDHRADIYSLGCTYYVLLTGKRPFEGNSVEEVVSKHHSAPLVMPSRIVERVPPQLSAIVAKMMAKRPLDRYQSMDELIGVLEDHLGIASAEAFTPSESDADAIEKAAKEFNASSLTKIRPLLPFAMILGCVLLAIAMSFVDWKIATGFLVAPIAAYLGYFLLSGIKDDGYLFGKTKEIVLQSSYLSWVKWILGTLLVVGVSLLTGTLIYWLIFVAFGVGLAFAYYFVIDKAIERSREVPIKEANQVIRHMRLKGMDEPTIQMFVAKYCGNHWEEFFEELFGYDNKRRVRNEIGRLDWGSKKPRFRKWRDGIYDRLSKQVEELSAENDQKHLKKVEQAGLEAQGLTPGEARQQAEQMAAALVDHGETIREDVATREKVANDPALRALQKRMKIKAMLADARCGKYKNNKTLFQRLDPLLNMFLGSYARFLMGCLLVLACLMWARQNEVFSIEELASTATHVLNSENSTETATQHLADLSSRETTPLPIPVVGKFFNSFNSLIAGMLLIFSMIVFGWRMALFALPAALIILCGESFGIPDLDSYRLVHSLSALIGVGIFVVGVVFGRSGD